MESEKIRNGSTGCVHSPLLEAVLRHSHHHIKDLENTSLENTIAERDASFMMNIHVVDHVSMTQLENKENIVELIVSCH